MKNANVGNNLHQHATIEDSLKVARQGPMGLKPEGIQQNQSGSRQHIINGMM